MENDESLFTNSKISQKKIKIDPIKEMFIKKKDIYLLNLFGKRKNQTIFRQIASTQKSYSVKNSSNLPKKKNLILNKMPKIQQKTNRNNFEINNSLIITNIPIIKEYNHIKKNSSVFKSTSNKYNNKSLNTINTSNINYEIDKLLNEDDQNESKNNVENRNKNNSLNRILLNYMKKIENNFKSDKCFIEYLKDKNIFITPNKPKKLLKRCNYYYHSITKNNISNNSIKNISSNNKISPPNIIKDLKIENPLTVIPCKKTNDRIKNFNDIIFSEYKLKKQNSIKNHKRFQTNIFEGNSNNYFNLYQKIYNPKNRRNENKIKYNNIHTITNAIKYPSFCKGKNNNKKMLVDKQNQIDFL